MYRTSYQAVGGTDAEPDYLYYNCDIINNQTDDDVLGAVPLRDPLVRFNETRDTRLIRDASQYYFSIIRFAMDGPGKDLPLFIPVIQADQPNPNLTTYAVGLTYSQTWNTSAGPFTFNLRPLQGATFVQYVPETQNPTLAPVPLPPQGRPQNLSTRYYWVYTYQHWLDLVNAAIEANHAALFATFQTEWNAVAPPAEFPYANYAAFKADNQPPVMTYDPSSQRFSIYFDSDCFGERLTTPDYPIAYPGGAVPATKQTKSFMKLFFNVDMYGLFSNFNNTYWNVAQIPSPLGSGSINVPGQYTNEILVNNKFYSNVVDYRIPPATGTPPLGYVPTALQKPYWLITQDWQSVDTMWSPIASIVFTTSLLPVRSEQTGQPLVLGTGNTSTSAATSQSAFQPIITDIVVAGPANTYKEFIYYVPTAEYRLADFSNSKQEVRNIDIQVFWRNRLDNNLYPISMFNLSNVSIKIMLRKK